VDPDLVLETLAEGLAGARVPQPRGAVSAPGENAGLVAVEQRAVDTLLGSFPKSLADHPKSFAIFRNHGSLSAQSSNARFGEIEG